MKTTKIFALALLGLVLTSAVLARVHFSSIQAGPIRIKYFGDSTVWGTSVDGSGDQYHNNPPHVLERELRARCGIPVVVENDAVPGTYASQLLYGSAEYLGVPFEKRMARSDARFVIFNFGMNDAAGYADVPSYRHHLSELVRIAEEHDKQVIFETPNPALPGGVTLPTQPEWLASLIRVQAEVAAKHHVPVVDNYHVFLSSGVDLNPLFPDGIHPIEPVAIEKARRVADTIEPLICPTASRAARWARLKWARWYE